MSGNPDQLPQYLAGRATTLIIFLSSCSPGYNEKKNHYMCSDEATSHYKSNRMSVSEFVCLFVP